MTLEKVSWRICRVTDVEERAFSSFSKAWDYEGQEISDDRMSRLTKVEVERQHYYIKAYKKRGKSLRRFLGRSRIRAEWENLQLITQMSIPTLELVAFGETQSPGNRRGILVTRELPGVMDLACLANQETSILQRQKWLNGVINRLSGYVRTMHDHKFVHGDLKWRNVLVNLYDDTEVYIIDCPQGRQLNGTLLLPLLNRAKIKDLACLDKVAKYNLSRTQRLRFYLRYAGLVKLNCKHKVRIRKILSFFKGRE